MRNPFSYGSIAHQVLTTRARKDVKLEDVKVHVLLFAFDCLFLNGDVLVEKTLAERRKALEAAIEPRQGILQIATSKVRTPLCKPDCKPQMDLNCS